MEGWHKIITAIWEIQNKNNLTDKEICKMLDKVKEHYEDTRGD